MFSPKELEGEVDHSFFDSDCDEGDKDKGKECGGMDGGDIREGGARGVAVDSSLESESPPRAKEPSGVHSPTEGRSRASSLLSEERSEPAPDPNSGSSAEGSEDGYDRSEEESEEENEEERHLVQGKVPVRCAVLKKSAGRFRCRSPASSTGSESSRSESESSASDTSPPRMAVPRPFRPASSPRPRPRLGELRLPEDSEDTVTDVTPLSTPDVSPAQSLDLVAGRDSGEGEGRRVVARQQNVGVADFDGSDLEGEKRSSPEAGRAAADPRRPSPASSGSGVGGRRGQRPSDQAVDLNQLLKAFINVEKRVESDLLSELPSGRARKNYSFSNEEVQRIDRENQRLLRELSRPPPRTGSAAATTTTTTTTPPRKPSSPPVRLYHSALNRQREQQRIERENMALLKRLESVKPTVGLKRSEQLADYQRQAGYLGTGALPATFDRSPSSRGSAGRSPRRCSASSLRNARPASSVSTAVSKARQSVEPRAAWS